MVTLPPRLVRNLLNLRDDFMAEVRGNAFHAIRYVLVGFRDDLRSEAVFGPQGLVREDRGRHCAPSPPGHPLPSANR